MADQTSRHTLSGVYSGATTGSTAKRSPGAGPPSSSPARLTARLPPGGASFTLRSNTGDLLGIVGADYEPLDNREAFRRGAPRSASSEAVRAVRGCAWAGAST
jgi:hypothetical protein